MSGKGLFVNFSKAIEAVLLFPLEEERCKELHQLYSTNTVINLLIEEWERENTLLIVL
tara:strand:- start:188 stop:361 length:174 start_codon:yes stop_codon:yes gene_type:complete